MTPLALAMAAWSSTLASPDTIERAAEQEHLMLDEEEVLSTQSGLEYADQLEWITGHPFDLNRITRGELLSLPGVSLSMADAVIDRRASGGRFRSPAELRCIPDIGEGLYRLISPYVSIPVRVKEQPAGVALRFRSTLADPGPTEALGSPVGEYVRCIASPWQGIEAGIVGEKDQGEPLRYGFASGYIKADASGVSVTLGDFSVEAGQGLVLRGGSGIGKSVSSPAQAGLRARGVTPHRSADEIRFFRGGAVTWTLGTAEGPEVSSLAFVSSRRLPASIDESGMVTSLLQSNSVTSSGLLAKSRQLREDAIGLRLAMHFEPEVELGVTLLRTRYDHDFRREDPLRMTGRRTEIAGFDFRYEPGVASFFGELAVSGGAKSFVIGTAARIAPKADLLMVLRRYEPRYDDPHAMGFGDGPDARNEWGCYAGLAWNPHPRLQVRGYIDRFHRIAPTSAEPLSGEGGEEAIAFEGTVSRRARMSLDYRRRSAETSVRVVGNGGWEVPVAAREGRGQWRWAFRCGLARGGYVRLKVVRVRAIDAAGAVHIGLLFSQEWSMPLAAGITATAGMSLFSTDGFPARVFDADASMPGRNLLVAMYGKGRRWFAGLRADPGSGVSIRVAIGSLEASPAVSSSAAPVEISSSRSWHGAIQCDVQIDELLP